MNEITALAFLCLDFYIGIDVHKANLVVCQRHLKMHRVVTADNAPLRWALGGVFWVYLRISMYRTNFLELRFIEYIFHSS